MDSGDDALINKLFDLTGKFIKSNNLSVRNIKLSNELLETLKIIKNCSGCKDKVGKNDNIEFYESINLMEKCLAELEKGEREQEKKVKEQLDIF